MWTENHSSSRTWHAIKETGYGSGHDRADSTQTVATRSWQSSENPLSARPEAEILEHLIGQPLPLSSISVRVHAELHLARGSAARGSHQGRLTESAAVPAEARITIMSLCQNNSSFEAVSTALRPSIGELVRHVANFGVTAEDEHGESGLEELTGNDTGCEVHDNW